MVRSLSRRRIGERNLFICQVTVSHRRIKPAASLIRKKKIKNQCVHCGGSPLWAHNVLKRSISDKDIYRSKIHLRSDLFCCTPSCNTEKKSKSASCLCQFSSKQNSEVKFWGFFSAQVCLFLSPCHRNMTRRLGILKRMSADGKHTSSQCNCLNRWSSLGAELC